MTRTEEIIRQALTEGQDPLTRFASELYSMPYAQVTKMQRQLAKAQAYNLLAQGGQVPDDLRSIFHG